MPTPIHGIHSSSRFSRSPVSLWFAFIAYLRTYIWTSFLSFTEVSKDSRYKMLTRWTPFRAVNVEGRGKDDCAFVFKKKDWDVLRVDAVALNKKHIPTYYFEALVATAQHKARALRGRRPVVFVGFHFPARIEGDGKLRDNRDGRAMLEALRTLNGLIRRWERHVGPVVICADWNLAWREPWVQRLLAKELPGVIFSFPDEGTHGRYRNIDGWAIYSPKGEIRVHRRAKVIKDDDSSDHRPVRIVLVYN